MKILSVVNMNEVSGGTNQAFLLAKHMDMAFMHYIPIPGKGIIKGENVYYATDSILDVIKEAEPDILLVHSVSLEMMQEIEKIRELTRVVYVAHFNFFELQITDAYRPYINPLISFMKHVDIIICLSEKQKELLSLLTNTRIRVIPVAIEYNKYKNMECHAPSNTFIMATRFFPIKNNLVPIMAMKEVSKKYPDSFLMLCGNPGIMLSETQTYINTLGLEGHVAYMGYKPHDLLIAETAASKALISSSFNENCSISVLEAKALGVPVIEEDPYSPKAFADAMIAMLDDYVGFKNDAEDNRVDMEKYDISNIIGEYKRVFKEVL